MDIAHAVGVSDKWGEEMTILVAVALLLNMILIHIEWKRIENLEKWVNYLREERSDESD